MSEPLTAYGELCNIPWVVGGKPSWNIATHEGESLYWEWKTGERGQDADDFLVFVRTVFPNGGAFCNTQSNNAVIWTPFEGDLHGVGIRKLRHGPSWILAVLETPEDYPGASDCPDVALSLKACRFLAEEFLRGTNSVDLFNCDPAICTENPSWWQYVEKLEKVVNWKYPEANIYRKLMGNSSRIKGSNHRERKSAGDHSRGRSKSASRRGNPFTRSRSPLTKRFSIPKGEPEYGDTRDQVKPKHLRTPGLRCDRCDLDFEQSFELMRHYNTDTHQNSLAKEFPF